MTDKQVASPDRTVNISSTDENESAKEADSMNSMNKDPNELRNKADLLGWLPEESDKKSRKSKQAAGRRRTTIVDSGIKRELADIIGKGKWVEEPTPDQMKQLQARTPVSAKYYTDMVSSSSSSSSSSALDPSGGENLTPELALKRMVETRRLFMDSVIAEIEEYQLRFALFMLVVIVILIHLFVTMIGD